MRLLKGLFTEHLLTKFMSLLLAVVLFAVVLQGITSTKTIEVIELEFRLARELRNDYAVFTPNVLLENVEIKGYTRNVEELTERFKRSKTQIIEIDQRFLALYPDTYNSIRINERFLHTHKVLPEKEKIELGEPLRYDPRLEIEKKKEFTLDLALATGMEERLLVSDDSPYEGARNSRKVEIEFVVPSLRVRVPDSVFVTPAKQLFVTIDDVDSYLRNYDGSGVNMRIAGIDWQASGIKERAFSEHAAVEFRGQWLPFASVRPELAVAFEVRERMERLKLPLDIEYRISKKKDLGFLAGHEVLGGVAIVGEFKQHHFEQGHCDEFFVRVPKGWKPDDPRLAPLVLVLDIAHASGEPTDDTIEVGIYLDVTDADRGDVLRMVQIERPDGSEGKPPMIRFTKKE